MSTYIYWFSGTGNSLYTARSIADGLKDDVELLPLASALKNKTAPPPGSRLGIVFPVYACGPPAILQQFIRRLPIEEAEFIFAVATYAATPGAAIGIIQKELKKRNLPLNTAYGVKMPENYPPMGGPPKEEKQNRILAEAETKIQSIIQDLNLFPTKPLKRGNFIFRLIGPVLNGGFRKKVKTADKKFYGDEKCTKCGTCVKVCPVDNIEIKNEGPVWLNHCEQCFACLHWCPESAIQYGKKSATQPRYHHPATALEDFL